LPKTVVLLEIEFREGGQKYTGRSVIQQLTSD